MNSLYVSKPAIAKKIPVSGTTIAQAQTTERRRVAVLDFDFASTSRTGFYYGWHGGIGPAKGVSDLLTDKLVRDGTYTLVERSKVAEVLKEQNFGASGRVDPTTAAQIGRVLGVDAVIIGTITEFNVDKDGSGDRVCFIVCVGNKKSQAVVQINSRLVSTTTGEILAVAEGKAKADKSSGNVEVGAVYERGNDANIDALLSTAAEDALSKMTTEIVAAASKLTTSSAFSPSVSAMVADITGNVITINKGSETGLKNGMRLSIVRMVRQVKDPQTGKVLRTVTSPVGSIQLTEVGDGYATGKVTAGKGFKVGDLAKAVN